MTRPTFSASLIADLRNRVIAHNESCQDKVTLNQLKKLYERAYKGDAPGERALRKVDDHLDGLAKAFDPSKHPRAGDGKFAGKAEAVGALPSSQKEHKQAQAGSAGYAALTSDVIPEQRGEFYGNAATLAIAGANGAILGHTLTSDNPESWSRRFVVKSTAIKPAIISRLAVGVPLHLTAAAAKLVEDKLGVKMNAKGIKNFAGRASDKASASTIRSASWVTNRAIDLARVPTQAFLSTMEGRPKTPPTIESVLKPGERLNRKNAFKVGKVAMDIARINGRAAGGRAAGKVFVAGMAAYPIYKLIHGSFLDPANLGRAYDETHYRTVQKMLAMPELETLTKTIVADLRKNQPLEKASPLADFTDDLAGKLTSKIATVGASAAASVAGSLAGAGTGAAVQAVGNALNKPEGNPYHDSKGRFTSKGDAEVGNGIAEAAAIGAGIGGLAAGGAKYFQIRQANRAAFRLAMDHLDAHVAEQTSRGNAAGANSSVDSIRRAYEATHRAPDGPAGLYANYQQHLDDFINGHPDMVAAKAQFDKYKNNSPLFYKDQAKGIANDKLTTMLAHNDDFMVPSPEKDAALISMKDLRKTLKGDNAVRHARLAIEGMDLEAFGKSIANLLPKEKEAALHHFEAREGVDAKVDTALAARTKAIDDAKAESEAAKEAQDALATPLRNADAEIQLHKEGTPEHDAAVKARDAVEAQMKDKGKAVAAAIAKHKRLIEASPKVEVDGKEIPAPNKLDMAGALEKIKLKLRPLAIADYEAKAKKGKQKVERAVAAAKAHYFSQLKNDHARQLATWVGLAKKSAGLRHILGKEADPLFKAHVNLNEAEHEEDLKAQALNEHAGRLATLESRRKGLPSARTPEDKAIRADLDAQIRDGKAAVKKADTEHGAAVAKTEAMKSAFDKEAGVFIGKYNKFKAEAASSKDRGFIPPAVVTELMAGITKAAKDGYDPISRYAIEPSAKHLKAVMGYVGPHADAIASGTMDRGKAMFGRERTINGKRVWVPDPIKLAYVAAPAAALYEFGGKSVSYAHGLLTGDKDAKAPTNLQVELQRHPTKDEGLFAVHAADPNKKGDRIILFGHRYVDGRPDPIDLNPGARLADVMRVHEEQKQQARTNNQPSRGNAPAKDADWLPEKVKTDVDAARGSMAKTTITGGGVSIPARDQADSGGNNAAGAYINEFRKKFISPTTHSNAGAFYSALDGLTAKQSDILKPTQMFQALTGYKPGDGKKGDGILKDNAGFGAGAQESQAALDAEITRALRDMPPRDEGQKDALRRAVAIIGKAKDIAPDKLTPIYDKIGGTAVRETVHSPAASQPEIPVKHATAPVDIPDMPEDVAGVPSESIFSGSDRAAQSIASQVGLDNHISTLGDFIALCAQNIKESHNVSDDKAVAMAKTAVLDMAGTDRHTKAAFGHALTTFNDQDLMRALNRSVRRQMKGEQMQKADFVMDGEDLEDFEWLAKRLPAAFSGAANQAQSGGGEAAPTYHPVKDSVAAAADLAGAGLANHVLNHVVPQKYPSLKTPDIGFKQVRNAVMNPVQSAKAAAGAVTGAVSGGAGNAIRAVGTGAKTLGILGAKGLVAGGLGAALYSGVQAATGGSSYRRNTSAGENLAMGGGNFGGSFAGEIAGKAIAGRVAGAGVGEAAGAVLGSALGPVGTVAGEIGGAAIGGALGEFLMHAAIQHFSGYNPKAVQRVLGTKVAPSPMQEQRAAAGEVGGGVIGNALGGAAGEGLGGAIGSAAGIASAAGTRVVNDVKSALPGRPKQQNASVP
jgi:hypothetical protein